jgi:hypothetical protein
MAVASCDRSDDVCPEVNRSFGDGVLDQQLDTAEVVDWPKVVVWLLMAALGLAVWAIAGWAVFQVLVGR